MVSLFKPPSHKVQFINSYVLYFIKSGSGALEVDFQNYGDWQDKLIYLSPGQYIKFLSPDFEVFSITFPDLATFESPDFRVLFKHLISLGYIDLSRCQDCQRFLSKSAFAKDGRHILDISADQWFWQNPFHADRQQYQVIFDLKEILDQKYQETISGQQLVQALDQQGLNVHQLVRDKLGITVGQMLAQKRNLESKRKIAFTNKSIQEISYESGFKDPAYFNRAFKKNTGETPRQFRANVEHPQRETFINDILELLHSYHHKHHQLGFYADKMNMSVPTLSKKIREKLNTSLGQLIRHEIISSAKKLLQQNLSIKEISYELGFEEPNHFSSFFKHYQGTTPSDFLKS